MAFFKQKVEFPQFVGDCIYTQLQFLENNFEKMAEMADEYKVLKDKDKKELKEKSMTLDVTDILLSLHQNISDRVSPEDINGVVSALYKRYLNEVAGLPDKKATDTAMKVMELAEAFTEEGEEDEKMREKSLENGYEMKKMDDYSHQKFLLCSAFGKYFAGKDKKAKDWEGRNFAAFKLAKAITKTDIVALSLKEVKVSI